MRNYHSLSHSEISWLKENFKSHSNKELAVMFDISIHRVSDLLALHGLKKYKMAKAPEPKRIVTFQSELFNRPTSTYSNKSHAEIIDYWISQPVKVTPKDYVKCKYLTDAQMKTIISLHDTLYCEEIAQKVGAGVYHVKMFCNMNFIPCKFRIKHG